jgi:hypothetical protein
MRELQDIQLDMSNTSREKIRAASRAILEAIISFRDVRDPAAHVLFGMTTEEFELAKQFGQRDILRLSSGLPIWKLRFDLAAIAPPNEGAPPVLDRERVVKSLLLSFHGLELPR